MAVLKSDPNIPVADELDKREGVCPWCNYANEDATKGPVHKKLKNLVRNVGTAFQCDTCGKHWEPSALGKAWSLEVERGENWARERRIRELRGA